MDYLSSIFAERAIQPKQRESLWKFYYDKLSKAVDVGWNDGFEIDDKPLVEKLKLSIAEFSAFKETSFRKSVEALLTTEDGKLRNKTDFMKEAMKVSDDYNVRWLETEYHQTIANANMAAKWKSFEENIDLYPNVKLVSVQDGRVRPEHKVLDGTIRPYNDPFWNTHTPPLDWGCRCNIIQTDEEPTGIPGGFQTKIEFENNPAETGRIFSKSAYLTSGGLNPEMIEEAGRFAVKMYKKVKTYATNYVDYLKYKQDKNYFDTSFDRKTGGVKTIHKLHNLNKKTLTNEKHVQNLFFEKGHKFTLENESSKIEGKKIDGFIEKFSHDISTIAGTGKNTIKRALNHGREKKADIAILYFPKDVEFNIERLEDGIKAYNGQTEYRFKKIVYIIHNKINYY